MASFSPWWVIRHAIDDHVNGMIVQIGPYRHACILLTTIMHDSSNATRMQPHMVSFSGSWTPRESSFWQRRWTMTSSEPSAIEDPPIVVSTTYNPNGVGGCRGFSKKIWKPYVIVYPSPCAGLSAASLC